MNKGVQSAATKGKANDSTVDENEITDKALVPIKPISMKKGFC